MSTRKTCGRGRGRGQGQGQGYGRGNGAHWGEGEGDGARRCPGPGPGPGQGRGQEDTDQGRVSQTFCSATRGDLKTEKHREQFVCANLVFCFVLLLCVPIVCAPDVAILRTLSIEAWAITPP